ncbi:hypothetical protein EV2_033006 [Malus domestica]
MLAVYASTHDKRMRAQWTELGKRISDSRGKCIVIGHFNDIVDDAEKEGNNYHSMASTSDFRDFLADNELLDLGFEGYPYTLRNKQDDRLIQQWFDRGVVTSGWMEMFSQVKINHVTLEGKILECRTIIVEAWKERADISHAFIISEKLKGTMQRLWGWKRVVKPNSKRRIDKLRDEIWKGIEDPCVRQEHIRTKEQ